MNLSVMMTFHLRACLSRRKLCLGGRQCWCPLWPRAGWALGQKLGGGISEFSEALRGAARARWGGGQQMHKAGIALFKNRFDVISERNIRTFLPLM